MSGDLQRDEPETFQPETTTGLPDENAVTVAEADPAGPVVRILILEDEALGADLAQRLLVRAGLNFSVVVVDTKASFIEQLAAFRPEVILADYRLPGFSGREALKIVQAEDPDIPFIFWSGVLADEAAVELIKQGATDYVMKDRPARLPAVILRALAEAERRARLAQLKDQLMQAQSRDSLFARGAPITSSLDTVAAPQSAGASSVPRPSWPNTTRTPSGPGTQEAPATGHRQRPRRRPRCLRPAASLPGRVRVQRRSSALGLRARGFQVARVNSGAADPRAAERSDDGHRGTGAVAVYRGSRLLRTDYQQPQR